MKIAILIMLVDEHADDRADRWAALGPAYAGIARRWAALGPAYAGIARRWAALGRSARTPTPPTGRAAVEPFQFQGEETMRATVTKADLLLNLFNSKEKKP